MKRADPNISAKIIKSAIHLFEVQGIAATRIEQAYQKVKVVRRTFYKRFKSKEALVLACIQHQELLDQASLDALVNKEEPDRAITWLRRHAETAPNLNYARLLAEFPAKKSSVHKAAQAARSHVLQGLSNLLVQESYPPYLADCLMALMEAANLTNSDPDPTIAVCASLLSKSIANTRLELAPFGLDDNPIFTQIVQEYKDSGTTQWNSRELQNESSVEVLKKLRLVQFDGRDNLNLVFKGQHLSNIFTRERMSFEDVFRTTRELRYSKMQTHALLVFLSRCRLIEPQITESCKHLHWCKVKQ
jgi:AcrR family transcriptional regulator